jgi:hypothetical protein
MMPARHAKLRSVVQYCAVDAHHISRGFTALLEGAAARRASRTSVPVPTFVFLCSTRVYERRNQRDTSNYMILVWLWI